MICHNCQREAKYNFYADIDAYCLFCFLTINDIYKEIENSKIKTKPPTKNSFKVSDKVRDNRLRSTYKNMSLHKYNKILKKQDGCCYICKKHHSEFGKALAVDHCHKTNDVRGLLCTKCNIGLGYFNDNNSTLKSAIKYLEDFEKTLTQQSQSDTINTQE